MSNLIKRMPKDKEQRAMEIFEDCYDPDIFIPMEGAFKIHDGAEAGKSLVEKITRALNARQIGVLMYHLTDDEFEFIGVARRNTDASQGMKFPL